MCQPCFDKTIIMYKYVGVYILVLMYNSYSMCYFGNIVEYIYIYIEMIVLQWNEWSFSTHVLI